MSARSVSLDRHQARILAMQWLCHNDALSGEIDEPLDRIARDFETSDSTLADARALCQRVVKASESIDKLLGDAIENWELNRISAVDRNVMRVATVELLDRKVPVKVVLNEAIEIAREYGSADSPRFVNGVLDAVRRNVDEG